MIEKHWCLGKTAYASKAEAIDRILCQRKDRRRNKRKGWSGDQTMVPYRCSTCKQWHVGGTSKATLRHRDPKTGAPLSLHGHK